MNEICLPDLLIEAMISEGRIRKATWSCPEALSLQNFHRIAKTQKTILEDTPSKTNETCVHDSL